MSPGLKAWLDSRNAADVPQELLDDLAREMRKAIPEIEREMRANAVRANVVRRQPSPTVDRRSSHSPWRTGLPRA